MLLIPPNVYGSEVEQKCARSSDRDVFDLLRKNDSVSTEIPAISMAANLVVHFVVSGLLSLLLNVDDSATEYVKSEFSLFGLITSKEWGGSRTTLTVF